MPHTPSRHFKPLARLSVLGSALAAALPAGAAQQAEQLPDSALAGLPGALIATLALGYALWARRREGRLEEKLRALHERHEALKQSLIPRPAEPAPQQPDPSPQLEDALTQALDHARRDGSRVALLLLDLCRFGAINDRFGRAGGDLLLGRILERLQSTLRDGDRVVRLRGDRFGVIQRGFHHREGVERLAGKLLEALAAPFELQGQIVTLSAALGSSQAPDDALNAARLLDNAALVLDQARLQGGGHRAFVNDAHRILEQHHRLSQELHHALPREQLSLRYRLGFDLRCQRVTGVEARLHWHHPHHNVLEPAEFLPLAEASGLIIALDEWLLYRACMQAAQWRGRFPGMRTMVRLSAATVAGPDLVGNLLQILADTGLEGDTLELLVPGTIFDHRGRETISANLTTLNQLGVVITLDEVLPARLPFDQLRDFGIRKLRLAARLQENMLESTDAATVVKALVGLGHELGLTVLADGVDNAEQVRHLRGLGCDQAQGRYFSLALPAEELHLLLCQRRQVA